MLQSSSFLPHRPQAQTTVGQVLFRFPHYEFNSSLRPYSLNKTATPPKVVKFRTLDLSGEFFTCHAPFQGIS